MSKLNVDQELTELISRFRSLKKAIAEEDKYTPAQQAAIAVVNQLRSSQVKSLEPLKKAKESADQQRSQQLANQLQQRGILGTRPPPPRQPTAEDQRMWLQNNGFPTEEMLKAQEANWGNSINSWLTEATKPLNSRFKSAEDEQAYWDNIKVDGGGGGGF